MRELIARRKQGGRRDPGVRRLGIRERGRHRVARGDLDRPSVTDIAAGSGFFGGHLFDGYSHFQPAPAMCFGLDIVRRPSRDIVTALGGGWIASGPPALDRLPKPVWPAGLSHIGSEAAGEVQTPLRGPGARHLGIGDRVWFRHTKSGEPAEHANEVAIIDRAPTAGRASSTSYRPIAARGSASCEQHRALGELGPHLRGRPDGGRARHCRGATGGRRRRRRLGAQGQTDRRRAQLQRDRVPTDIQVRLSQLRGVVSADAATRAPSRWPRAPTCEIPRLLAPLGLAMANLGDVDRQTVAGATSTGTHGTGAAFGGISTQIAGVTLVNGRASKST